ncbi:hypothetical protein EO241_29775 [Escherichia coli]|nr:hypothetical protein EO241_29775 [Escherichia coli]
MTARRWDAVSGFGSLRFCGEETARTADRYDGRALFCIQNSCLFCKRKLTAVCSHQTRIGNLDAHLI